MACAILEARQLLCPPGVPARQSDLHGHVEDDHEVRDEAARGEVGDGRQRPVVDAAAVALVGHGGRRIAVADDDVAPHKGRTDDVADMLRAGRVEEQDIGDGATPGLRRVQHDGADLFTEGCAARLPREGDRIAALTQPLGQSHRLLRLAGAVRALQHDEAATGTRGGRDGSRAGQRHGSQRQARALSG